MDKYKPKFTSLQSEIIKLLCIKAGITLNQRQIAKLLKVSPTAVAKSLNNLKKDEIIKIKKSGTMNLNLIELNRDSPKTIAIKRIENFKLVYTSGLADFLADKFPGSSVILFGSFSRGEDIERSDIDIAVIGSKGKTLDLAEFEAFFEKRINVQFYEDLNKINKNLKASILNGIILIGFVEV